MKLFRVLITTILFILPTALFVQEAYAAPIQTFNVSWSIPTTRADGSALSATELSGYEIYYTVDSGQSQTIVVSPGSSASKLISFSLPAKASPYVISFAMVAIDTNGLKSALSQVVQTSVTVQNALPSPATNVKVSVTCVSGSCSMTVQ